MDVLRRTRCGVPRLPGSVVGMSMHGDTTIPDWVVGPARRAVAARATDAADARDLLEMLGLIEPTGAPPPVRYQVLCAGPCGRPGRLPSAEKDAWPGTVLIAAVGRCGTCYRKYVAETKARDVGA